MPQSEERALTDQELLAVFKHPQADLSLLSREERARLVQLTEGQDTPAGSAPPTAAPPADEDPRAMMERLIRQIDEGEARRTRPGREALPMIGGAVGGLVGGIPGAILGGAGGAALRDLGRRGAGEPASETPIDAAREIAVEGGIQGAAEGVGGAVMKGAQKGARAVYRGYLKPSLAEKNLGKADEVVETALREGLPISRGGSATAQRRIGDLKAEVDRLLANTPGAVDLKQIADRVRGFAKGKYYKPGGDPSDHQAALGVADRLDTHPSLGLPPGAKPSRVDVSLQHANEAKRSLQSGASSSYGVPNAGAKKAAEKTGGHELRTALEAKAPAIAPLNARESKLIDAARAIRRAVEREANQSKVYGVKTLASIGGGGAIGAGTGDPLLGLAAGAAGRRLLEPDVMSGLAIVTNKIAKELGVSMATASRLAAHVLREPGEQSTEGNAEADDYAAATK